MEQMCLVELYTRWQRDASEIEPHAHVNTHAPNHNQPRNIAVALLSYLSLSLAYISHLLFLPFLYYGVMVMLYVMLFFLNPDLTDSYCLMLVFGFLCSRDVAAMQQTDTQRSGRRCARRVQNKACISPASPSATLTAGKMCAQAFINL